jgi:hypothetical protein
LYRKIAGTLVRPYNDLMTQAAFNRLAGTIFLLVALLHAARLFFRWEVLIAGLRIPLWVSGPALVLAGFLAYTAFRRKGSVPQ